MENINANDLNILTTSEVENSGIEFIEAIIGLLYERYPNGTLANYTFYKDGVPHGVTVEFYRNGKIREHKHMEKLTIKGRGISWFESGEVKLVVDNKYGFKLYYQEWDGRGDLIKEKQEPTVFEKGIIDKYDSEV